MRYHLFILLSFFLLSCTQPSAEETLRGECKKLSALDEPKKNPLPEDWITYHTEVQEPLNVYLKKNPPSPTARQCSLYIVQLGTFDAQSRQLIAHTRTYLQAFFQLPVAELPAIPVSSIPAEYTRKNSYGIQLKTTFLLDSLLPALMPDSAFALIAFSANDLYPADDWNFVFGQAGLQSRVGVWSIARLGNYHQAKAAFAKTERRVLQVAAHETGHIFGIPHCVQYECCMNGSNSLAESDRQRLWLCSECLAKICSNRKIAPQYHVRSLLQFHQTVTHDRQLINYYRKAWALLQP